MARKKKEINFELVMRRGKAFMVDKATRRIDWKRTEFVRRDLKKQETINGSCLTDK